MLQFCVVFSNANDVSYLPTLGSAIRVAEEESEHCTAEVWDNDTLVAVYEDGEQI